MTIGLGPFNGIAAILTTFSFLVIVHHQQALLFDFIAENNAILISNRFQFSTGLGLIDLAIIDSLETEQLIITTH